MNNEPQAVPSALSPISPLETSTHRFRLSQVEPSSSNLVLQKQSPELPRTRPRSDPKPHPACHRCRRLKKRCSRTFPECVLCTAAGVSCSIGVKIEPPETAQLQARIEWLSKIINETIRPACPVEKIETGSAIFDNNPASEVLRDFSDSTDLHDHSGIAAVLASMSSGHLSGITEVAETRLRSSGANELQPTAQLPQDAACRRFVGAYFRHVHRAYPFVDQGVALAALESIGSQEHCQADPTSTKLYLIMAIGCTTLQRAGQIPDTTSEKFVISYTRIVQECLVNPSAESVEILLLLSLYSLFDPSGLPPWTLLGLLTRQAISIGITRDDTKVPLSPLQVELRRRLYWSIFVLDRMVSVYTGLPNGFNDENAGIPLPGVTVQEFGAPNRVQSSFSLQISRHVIQLRQLEEKILRKVHLAGRKHVSSLSGADKRIILHDLRSHIENWYSHGCLLSPTETDNIPFHSTISWLTVRYYNLLILLHGPSHFNSELSKDQLDGLQQYIQKYVQSSVILLQQRQLPLNWITLYRFLPICSILLYCFVRNQDRTFAAQIELITCAEILESFPSRWAIATRSAQVFRAFASLANQESSASNTSLSPAPTWNSAFESGDASDYSGTKSSAELQALITETNELVSEVLGRSSAYTYIESLLKHRSDWENSQPDAELGNVGEQEVSWQDMEMDYL